MINGTVITKRFLSLFCLLALPLAAVAADFSYAPGPDKWSVVTTEQVPIFLNFANTATAGGLQLSEIDQKLLAALQNPASVLRYKVKRILLDPGHGGTADGAVGKLAKEKTVNLQLALAVKQVLTEAGFEVFLTRDSDYEVPLLSRAQLGLLYRADLFISLHHNATADHSPEMGMETYVMTAPDAFSTGALGTEKKPALPGNLFDCQSFIYGYYLQKAICAETNLKNRGLKHARFMVLAQGACPAVLLECGFITTPQDEVELIKPERQQKIASAIAKAILEVQKLIE